jgi:hypothetical protein
VTSGSLPQLALRLPGRWISLDPREGVSAEAQLTRAARELVGTADDAAEARRQVREQFTEVLRAAREAQAQRIFVCHRISGLPVPAAITVHTPDGLRMAPTVGTAPSAVITTFSESLRELGVEGVDDATRLAIDGAEILRLVREPVETVTTGDGQQITFRRLRADYWYSMPGTKQIVLVSMTTQLGDIRNVMLQFFDAIATTAAYVAADA